MQAGGVVYLFLLQYPEDTAYLDVLSIESFCVTEMKEKNTRSYKKTLGIFNYRCECLSLMGEAHKIIIS